MAKAAQQVATTGRQEQEQNQGEGKKTREDGLHVVRPGVDVAGIGHLAEETQHVFLVDEVEKTLSAMRFCVGQRIPSKERQEGEGGEQ